MKWEKVQNINKFIFHYPDGGVVVIHNPTYICRLKDETRLVLHGGGRVFTRIMPGFVAASSVGDFSGGPDQWFTFEDDMKSEVAE